MLITCPECNGKVSTMARFCPHCGWDPRPLCPRWGQQEKVVPARASARSPQQSVFRAPPAARALTIRPPGQAGRVRRRRNLLSWSRVWASSPKEKCS